MSEGGADRELTQEMQEASRQDASDVADVAPIEEVRYGDGE